jgi:RimJ/RimL family protein N-acetyltransferase
MGATKTMTPSLAGPAYRIQSARLVIRCWNPADAALLKSAVDDSIEHLLPWMPWAKNEPQEIEQKFALLRQFRGKFDLGQDFVYGIFNREETRVLGGTGLHTRLGEKAREIGYWIHKDFTNQGLATETAAALTKVAFEVDHVDRVEIHCDSRNIRSAAVPRKLGFLHEATLHNRQLDTDGKPRDTMIWTLFAQDYPNSPAVAALIEAFDVANRRIL